MNLPPRRSVTASRMTWTAWLRILLAVTLIAPFGTGCLSHEYTIPRSELSRLAELPPEARGQRVRVIQELGERRGEAIPAEWQARSEASSQASSIEPRFVESPVDPDAPVPTDAEVAFDMTIDVGSPDWSTGSVPSRGRGVARPPSVAPTVRGTPRAGGGGGGGGGGFNLGGGGGGGGGGGDALVVLAVVVVGAAIFATIGLAASEGARFDGHARMDAEQPVHVKDSSGRVTLIPLAFLSRELAATAVEATVMDDEGAGLRRLDDAPLDRVGGAFKLELGTSAFNFGTSHLVGPMAHIQAGGFVTPTVGIFLDAALSGGSDCCVGTIVRHSLAVEVDVLPLKLGPMHAGVFAKAGGLLAGGVGNRLTGGLAGGGALIEFDLNSRLALIVRAGANAARLDDGWSTAGTLTAGLAIY